MYGASLGLKSLGRVPLGGERFVTYGTMPYVTLGRRSERIHWHGLDPDVKAFFDIAFTPSSQLAAPNPNDIWTRRVVKCVDQLVKELKADGFWSICSIIYPFALYHPVAAGQFATGFNLKNPGTAAANFFLLFGGQIATHNEYGTAFNNGSSSCNTQFNPGTSLGTNDWHFCCYLNLPNGSSTTTMTLTSCNAAGGISMLCASDASLQQMNLVGNGITLNINPGPGGRKGCFIGTRTSSTSMSAYRSGLLIGNSTSAATTSLPSRSQKIMYNEALGNNQCTVPFNFFSMGSSLTDDQAFRLSQIVQDYETRMGRGV